MLLLTSRDPPINPPAKSAQNINPRLPKSPHDRYSFWFSSLQCFSLQRYLSKYPFFTMPLKFMSLNSKGPNSPFKCSALLKEAHSLKADIIFTQESHLAVHKCPWVNFQHFPHLYMANILKKACGVFFCYQGLYGISSCTHYSRFPCTSSSFASSVKQSLL